MKALVKKPNCLDAGNVAGRMDLFRTHNAALERIQKSLEAYLETKRVAFSRFYFLSNDELLEILSQARNVQAVQPFLLKCFDALAQLEFGSTERTRTTILAMISPKGERIALPRNTKASGRTSAPSRLLGLHLTVWSERPCFTL